MASSFDIAPIILYVSYLYIVSTLLVILITGLIGSIANIIIFTTFKQFRGYPSSIYIIAESIADIGVLVSGAASRLMVELFGFDSSQQSVVLCKLRMPVMQWFASMVISMTAFSAVDQYFATSGNPRLRQFTTIKLAKYFTCIATIVWIFYNIPFVIFYEITVRFGCLINNALFIRYFTFIDLFVLRGLMPIIITSLFSILAYQNVRRIRRQRLSNTRRKLDRQLTAMILARVLFGVCCAIPYFLQRFYVTQIQTDPHELRGAIEQLVIAICVSLTYANASMSFYIFLITSSRFRRQAKYILIKRPWRYCRTVIISHRFCFPNSVAPSSTTDNNELDSTV